MTTDNPPAEKPDETDDGRPKARPLRVVRFPNYQGRPGSGYVSPMDESVEWDGNDAA